MSNVSTYNQIINRFKAWASAHEIVKHFSHGSIDVMDIEKFPNYPFMHVMVNNATYSGALKQLSVSVVFCDLPRNNDVKTEYQAESISDMMQIAEDLIASVTFSPTNFFGDSVDAGNFVVEPFVEQYENTLTGVNLSFDLLIPFSKDACNIPSITDL